MKTTLLNFKALIAFLFFISFLTFKTEAHVCLPDDTNPPRWEFLGQKKVDYGLDRDEIYVTAKEGAFTKVKLIVRKSGINLHRVVIHFGNGGTQEVQVRNNLSAGSETRVIDINGGKRVIKKVVFWYDTKNYADRKAVLELWGRH